MPVLAKPVTKQNAAEQEGAAAQGHHGKAGPGQRHEHNDGLLGGTAGKEPPDEDAGQQGPHGEQGLGGAREQGAALEVVEQVCRHQRVQFHRHGHEHHVRKRAENDEHGLPRR
jgi:hypothetical protein